MSVPDLSESLRVKASGNLVTAHIHDQHDVFGVPHGGYLAGLSANAMLAASGQPDVFSISVHFLRKAAVGPITFHIEEVAKSRRFRSLTGRAIQDDNVLLSLMALVGDRDQFEGPTWTAHPAPNIDETNLSARAGESKVPFQVPNIAVRGGLRLDEQTLPFARGERSESTLVRGVMEHEPASQLTAIVACDLTPPAVWNALGPTGWVPTVELTAHVRARPKPGPFKLEVLTNHVAGGFLEEDALIFDAAGTLIVQSRQLARWSQAPPR